MFDNIGSKLKTVAQIFTGLGIAGSILFGIILIAAVPDAWFVGLIILVFGSIGSWLSSLGMYGLGQLIENTDTLVALQKKPRKLQKTSIEDIEDNLPEL